jgi:hypothetical protein
MMGALILLLVVIARHARAQASIPGKLAAPAAAAAAADEKARREELDWRREQLAAQRDRTQAELSERRLELGHFEEHARSLRAELDELERAQRELEKLASTDEDQKRELAARVAAINLQISETQAKLLRARQQLEAQPTSYSVVPYLGPNSTGRPPLYIECRNDRVILQPEGVTLTAEDFAGPLGPTNPLASALRAAREHMARNRRTNVGEMGEPYPLLLVRPDGIMAYWLARAALESWGADFGYELIDADWKLDFKAPDTELARTEETALAEARVHQRELAMMMPRLQGQSVGRQYRASSHGGGIVADEDIPEEDRPGHRKYGVARNGRSGYFDPYPQSNPANQTAAAGAAGSAFGQRGSGGLGFGSNGNGSGNGFGSGAVQGNPGGGHSLMGGNDGGLYPGEATLGSSDAGGPMGTGGPRGPMGSGSGNGTGAGGFGSGSGPGGNTAGGGSFAGTGNGGNGTGNGGQSGGPNGGGPGSGGPNGGGANGSGPNGNGQGSGDSNGVGQMAAAGAAGFAAGAATNGSNNGANGNATGGANGSANGSANGTGPGGASSESNTGGAADGPKLAAPGGAQGAAGGDTAANGGVNSGGDPNGTLASNASNAGSGGPSRGGQPGAPDSRNPFSSPLDSYGTTSARSGAPGGTSVTSPSSSGYSGGGAGAGGSSPGTPSPSVNKSTPPPGSMAEHRGKNWAVPNDMRKVAPVTRPVMIRCSQSSLVILADDGSGKQVRAVPLGENTEESVDDLIAGVWEHISSWGLAGHGMYWHPVLVLDTTADGQTRAADLKRLMAGSGIDVRDKQVNPPVARAKKKRWWQW